MEYVIWHNSNWVLGSVNQLVLRVGESWFVVLSITDFMYGCERWTIKKAEHQRTEACELWGWRTILRVPRTARRSNQSILKEINPDIPWKRLMLKLKLQHFGHLIQRADSLEKTLWYWDWLRAGREGDGRGWDGWMASSTQWTWVCVNSWSWWWTPWGRKELDMTVTELNWTDHGVWAL